MHYNPADQVVTANGQAGVMPERTPGALRHNLPAGSTSFIGRKHELAGITRALRVQPAAASPSRMVTLTGTGGSGKTRLAIEAATELVPEYPDGVWLVELAGLADPDLVPRAVAGVLHLREQVHAPLTTTLVEALRTQTLLLVLDNCEHLIRAAAVLADALLQGCPALRILATSREPLNIAGEVVWPLPPLPVPPAGQAPSLIALLQYEAIQLAVERAQAIQPGFALTEGNAQSVTEICLTLDGLPLAIELAVARLPALPLQQIAARLDRAFQVLTSGSRTALPRHQTLRAAMDWSYALLTEPEKILFRRLSAFAGGWTLTAAEGVCAGEGVDPDTVLDLLASLIAKSIVTMHEHDGSGRYSMLEPVRQYAHEKLLESGEEARVRRQHALFFRDLAEELEPVLWGATQASALEILDADHENLRVALRWTIDTGEVEIGLRLGGALWRFWFVHGHLTEGREWLAALDAANHDEPLAVRGKLLNGAGVLAVYSGDTPAGIACFEEALPLLRADDNASRAAGCLMNLGGAFAGQGDLDRAEPLLREALDDYRQIGHVAGIALAMDNLGHLYLQSGSLPEAIALLEESVRLFRESNDGWGLAIALIDLGDATLEAGDAELARTRLAEGLALAWADGDRVNLMHGLEAMARALADPASRQWTVRHAARLYGAAQELREAIGAVLSSVESSRHARSIATIRERLDADTVEVEWSIGRSMTLEEAVALASDLAVGRLEPSPALAPGATSAPASPTRRSSTRLSEREIEVLRLVAQGMTDAEVADRLFISRRTVGQHLRSIYNKLGVNSRVAATRIAIERGLT